MTKKKEDRVKICPRCGNTKIVYRPGIDVGMMHAICMYCGYEANAPLFPEISKRDAKKIRVKSGKELEKIVLENRKKGKTTRIIALAAVVIFLIILFFMIY